MQGADVCNGGTIDCYYYMLFNEDGHFPKHEKQREHLFVLVKDALTNADPDVGDATLKFECTRCDPPQVKTPWQEVMVHFSFKGDTDPAACMNALDGALPTLQDLLESHGYYLDSAYGQLSLLTANQIVPLERRMRA